MALYEFEGRRPDVDDTAYVSHSAEIVGDVTIGKDCFIGPGAKIKGDYGTVVVGDNTNIQENCVVHARPGEKTVIGDWVTVGHGAIIHGPEIKDYAVIGMGAIISDFAVIGEWSVVGEGALVTNEKEIPDEKVAVGVPAKIVKEVDEEYKEKWRKYKETYKELSTRYKENLTKL
ncbi:MAG: gamma carbonic anhydrase family protein [Candidatus Thermoplasmatota archaeon]